MIDLKLFRSSIDEVRELLGSKRYDAKHLEDAFTLDERRRQLLVEVETARAEKNSVSKEIGKAAAEDRQGLIASMKALGDKMASSEEELARVKEDFELLLCQLPNPPHASVPPEPLDEDIEGTLVYTGGEKKSYDFKVQDHLELGEKLGWINIPAAAKISGSRFGFLHDGAVLLQNALVSYVGGKLYDRGFTLTIPPVMVREKAMFDTGFFPAEKFEVYKLENEDLFLVGTSEVPLASLHADDTLDASDLPRRYAGYSTCFRREAGAYGKDTRGIFRVHQFDKLEMFSFCHPDKSYEELEFILETEKEIMDGLGLHYRVINIAASDLGNPAAKKYDIEAWIPSQEKFRELTSCSNCTDFQARRLGVRVKDGKKKSLLHTLNGTAVAIGRMLIAIMETHQLEDGSIKVPEVLQPFIPGQREVLSPR